MMREAQKMMQDPQFQAYMKSIMNSTAFEGAMKKTKEKYVPRVSVFYWYLV